MTPPKYGTSRVLDRQAQVANPGEPCSRSRLGCVRGPTSTPREDRVALLQHEVDPEELSDPGTAVCPGGVLKFLEVEKPVVQGEAHDRPPCDLCFDAGGQECGRSP